MTRAPQILCLLAAAASLRAQVVDIRNVNGDIEVRVAGRTQVQVRGKAEGRELKPGEVSMSRQPNAFRITTAPADQSRINVTVTVPFGLPFRAETRDGRILVRGLVARAGIVTASGDIEIEAPWRATRLVFQAEGKPATLQLPEGIRFSEEQQNTNDFKRWVLRDRLPDLHVTYGVIQVNAGSTRRVRLADVPIPEDSPVKMPWQAEQVLDGLLSSSRSPVASSSPAPAAAESATTGQDGLAVFRSDVRVVGLNVSVTDRKGAPVPNLTAADFEVLEDNAPQDIRFAGSEEVPFNLALLLDLSGSTRDSRKPMQEAARQFLNIARPQDQMAFYALANDWFTVVSRLTKDRAKLLKVLEAIPAVSGMSPVYDTIVLAYAEEFLQRPNERNALIVLTDGVDNQIHGGGVPSEVSFRKLRQAAAGMSALIYPVVLSPFERENSPGWARKAVSQMEQLAEASGGKAFQARSIEDLSPIYPQVAEEMRSVYSLSYSPKNQEFNGAWRRITVRVKRPDLRVRSRSGYFARP